MKLQPDDLHFTYQRGPNVLKAFDPRGKLVFACACRNRATADGHYGHDGNCPPGTFILGAPIPKNSVPFGAWFIPILDDGPHGPMALYGRSGIGIHAGGSGLAQPLAPRQSPPWVPTHGCLRVLNRDLAILVKYVHTAQKQGKCYLTVAPRAPGAEDLVLDDYVDVSPDDLDPDE